MKRYKIELVEVKGTSNIFESDEREDIIEFIYSSVGNDTKSITFIDSLLNREISISDLNEEVLNLTKLMTFKQ